MVSSARDSPASGEPDLGVSICICTRARPRELERCLKSIRAGTRQPAAVIVSDDERSPAVAEICARYQCRYVEGPARGLCANRNHAIAHVETSHLALVDDDGLLGEHFVEEVMSLLPSLAANDLITGTNVDPRGDAGPTRATYLGFFAPAAVGAVDCFSLNSNVLPRSAFDLVEFDEEIVYGYEDMDVAAQLIALGFRIRYEPRVWNSHLPAATGMGDALKQRHSERARYYVALKRRLYRHPDTWLPRAGYVAVAGAHSVLHALRRGSDPRVPLSDIAWAWKAVRRYAQSARFPTAPHGGVPTAP